MNLKKYIALCGKHGLPMLMLAVTWLGLWQPLTALGNTPNLPVLTYHHILPQAQMEIYQPNNPWTVSVENFYRQLRFLYENDFTAVTNAQVVDFVHHGVPLPPRAVKIHFDDGYYSNFVYAYPILRQFGMIATNFVIGHVVQSLSGEQPPLNHAGLTFANWQTLYDSQLAFEIASHSFDMHRAYGDTDRTVLAMASYEDVLADTLQSFDFVINRYSYAYPWGQHSPTAVRALQSAGIRIAFTTQFGHVTRQSDPMRLPRIMVLQETDLHTFAQFVGSGSGVASPSVIYTHSLANIPVREQFHSAPLVTPTESAPDTPLPDNFNDFVVSFHLLADNIRVERAWLGALYASNGSNQLLRSVDHGESWTVLYSFGRRIDSVYVNDRGYVFVAVTSGRFSPHANSQLFRSVDQGHSFELVLDIESGAPFHWSYASLGNLMFVSEYGYHGTLGGVMDNARRVYRSTDYGQSWEVVFSPTPVHNWHNHVTVLAGDVLYQSIGDFPHQRVLRSTDNGNSFSRTAINTHPTSAIVLDDYILWGLDGYGGVLRYHRHTGRVGATWRPPAPFTGPVYDMLYVHGIIYALFLSYEGAAHPASIWFSRDYGHNWELLGRIDKAPHEGVGLWSIFADGYYAYVAIQTPVHMSYGENRTFFGTLRFELLNGSK